MSEEAKENLTLSRNFEKIVLSLENCILPEDKLDSKSGTHLIRCICTNSCYFRHSLKKRWIGQWNRDRFKNFRLWTHPDIWDPTKIASSKLTKSHLFQKSYSSKKYKDINLKILNKKILIRHLSFSQQQFTVLIFLI